MSTKIQQVPGDKTPADEPLQIKEIPGSYGIPFLTPIMDRLDFYSGPDRFFQTRVDRHRSTVFRVNMPPGPFMASNPKVIVLLDAKSFPVLFDVTKVEKKNVFTGTYMPSTKLTGGYRVCSYLDPSEPKHAILKQLILSLLASRKNYVIPSFRTAYSSLFAAMEDQLAAASGAKADFNKLNDNTSFDFIGDVYFGLRPSSTSLGTTGPAKATKWLFFQLCPILTVGRCKILEELFLHTFPLPSFLVKSEYNALYDYINSAAATVIDEAMKFGLSRDEACHNFLFATFFNTYPALKALFPGILKWLALADRKLHDKLAQEIRAAVKAEGGKVTLATIERMELTQSVVYEALRMDPPVRYQYGKAKKDLIIQSHDAGYKVKKGEMLFGYQPFATRDTKVFENGDEFVGDRFVGEAGKKLLKYVLWSNGRETDDPAPENKQCAGKHFVGLVGRLFLAEFFLRYDTFKAEVEQALIGTQINVTSLTKTAN